MQEVLPPPPLLLLLPPLPQGLWYHCQLALDGTRGWRPRVVRRVMIAACPVSASAKTMPPDLPKLEPQEQSEWPRLALLLSLPPCSQALRVAAPALKPPFSYQWQFLLMSRKSIRATFPLKQALQGYLIDMLQRQHQHRPQRRQRRRIQTCRMGS